MPSHLAADIFFHFFLLVYYVCIFSPKIFIRRTLSLHFPYPSAIITGIQDSRKSRLSLFLGFSFIQGRKFRGGIGWIRGKQCCGRHRFAAVLTTHFRASSFRGMYFLQRYRPSCCCSRAVSASDATVSGLSDFDEANVGEWQTSNCIFDYVDSMLRKPRCISRQAVEFLDLLRCLERTRLKFFFFQRITLRIVFLSFEFFEFIK